MPIHGAPINNRCRLLLAVQKRDLGVFLRHAVVTYDRNEVFVENRDVNDFIFWATFIFRFSERFISATNKVCLF